MGYVVIFTNGELYHSGIKGMKWGVRRYQNPDGTLTEEGKKRYSVNSETGEITKKKMSGTKKAAIAAGVLAGVATLSVAAAEAHYLKGHPEAIKNAISKAKSFKLGEASDKLVANGHAAIKKAFSQSKEGLKEGINNGFKEGPSKLAKATVTGAFMVGGYKALENAVGKSVAKQMMAANNPKKIDKFMNKPSNDDDDDN